MSYHYSENLTLRHELYAYIQQKESWIWWWICSHRSPISLLGYRGYSQHLRRLQIRMFFETNLFWLQGRRYRHQHVTWWHVFGLRQLSGPAALDFPVDTGDSSRGIRYFVWYEA